MPGKDGTGPITGRGFGLCAGNRARQGVKRGICNGFGNGRGMGRGLNCNIANNLAQPQKDELILLKKQAETVESHLNTIKNRISELEQ